MQWCRVSYVSVGAAQLSSSNFEEGAGDGGAVVAEDVSGGGKVFGDAEDSYGPRYQNQNLRPVDLDSTFLA